MKKVKLDSKSSMGFPQTSIREMNILLLIDHPNIIRVKEVVVGKKINE